MKFFMQFKKEMAIMLISTLIFSGLNIAILAYIKTMMISSVDSKTLLVFAAFLLGFLLTSFIIRATITTISQNFVYNLRVKTVQSILKTRYLKIHHNRSKLIASLTSDIPALSSAFNSLPELIQGGFLIIGVLLYIAYLNTIFFCVIVLILILVGGVNLYCTQKTHQFYKAFREGENLLYKDYLVAIEGHKELNINHTKMEYFLNNKFIKNSLSIKNSIINANIYGNFMRDFTSVAILGIIGLVFYLGLNFGITNLQNSTTISLAILFIRSPFMIAIASIPNLQRANIALNNLKNLDLDIQNIDTQIYKNSDKFDFSSWKQIRLQNISFSYGEECVLKDINLQINRGEIIFLTGENGVGKSTLFLIIAGIIKPDSGEIYIDNELITDNNLKSYQNIMSVIFNEPFLFEESFYDDGKISQLLKILELKLALKDGKFIHSELSSGQKKRLAMLNALLENKSLLLLDEWCSDIDPKFRRRFYEKLIKYIVGMGYTIFMITHDDRFFGKADKIYDMNDLKQINYLEEK
ncbi:MAG: ATP-binding cassette domain-containing protein [Campylobacter sp.]|nr:ATP-binding cassette domain-containing protein [Campylobacter sp.]